MKRSALLILLCTWSTATRYFCAVERTIPSRTLRRTWLHLGPVPHTGSQGPRTRKKQDREKRVKRGKRKIGEKNVNKNIIKTSKYNAPALAKTYHCSPETSIQYFACATPEPSSFHQPPTLTYIPHFQKQLHHFLEKFP